MNENFNEPINGSTSENADKTSEAVKEVVNEASRDSVVSFNEDGTYSSGRLRTENEKSNTENQNEEKSSAGSYYAHGQSNASSYGRYSENVFQGNSYPYGNNNTYPYGNQGSYPYGNNYNNQNRAYQNNRVPGQQGFAYPSDNGKGKKGNGSKIFAIVAGVLCVFLVIALISVIAGDVKTPVNTLPESTTENTQVEEFVTNASPITGTETNADGELSPKAIFQKVLPSSVGILVYNSSKTLASEGSGVLFQESTDGKYTYIITCAHVIDEASGYIRVQLYDGKEYDANVVGYDARTDIGVIRIEKTGLILAEIGDSSKIEVGDYVYAIGNPGGVEFANSFTNGIASALDRPVNSSSTGYTTECIQHTAAINPGNSGGALVNSYGQIIGINSMKIVADEYEGMGFAVPSSVFVEIVNEIMKHGYVSNRPKLGITYVAASEYSTYGMFVAIKGLPTGSIVIYDISSDSALKGTKVQKGDMIVAVNGVGLDSPSYLSEIIEKSKVGDELTLSLIRINSDYSYEEFDVKIALVEDRGDTFIAEEETTKGSSGGNYSGSYDDFFNQYFEDFFGSYFGGSSSGR